MASVPCCSRCNATTRFTFALPLSASPARSLLTTSPPSRLSHTRSRPLGMAWRSSGSSNDGLITNLRRNGLIESARVEQAMRKVHHGSLQVVEYHQHNADLDVYAPRLNAHTMHPPIHTRMRLRPSATELPYRHLTCTHPPVRAF